MYRNNVKYSSLLFSILTRFKYHPTETVQCYKDRGGKFSLRMGFSSSRRGQNRTNRVHFWPLDGWLYHALSYDGNQGGKSDS